MASGDFNGKGVFPAGTVVGAYLQSDQEGGPVGPPEGSAADTDTVAADGTYAFQSLSSAPYYAVDQPQSCVQSVKVDATAGNFRLRVTTPDGVSRSTPSLKFNITAANLKAELEALSNVGSGQIASVTGGPGDSGGTTPYVVTFGGTLANMAIAAIVASSGAAANGSTALANVSGGGAAVTVSVTTVGTPGGSVYVGFMPDLA